jgi:hypothetical protein
MCDLDAALEYDPENEIILGSEALNSTREHASDFWTVRKFNDSKKKNHFFYGPNGPNTLKSII